MSFAVLAILLPGAAAGFLLFLGGPGQGAAAGFAVNAVVFLFTLAAFGAPGTGMVHADPAGLLFGALSGLVGVTTAWTNLTLARHRPAALSPHGWRIYHAAGLILLSATLAGLYADSLGLLWLAAEIAAIAGVVCVRLPATQAAFAAARRGAAAAIAGLALAGFGTMLVSFAASPLLAGTDALSLLALGRHAAQLNGPVLTLAFVLILSGYGVLIMLSPFNAWLTGGAAGVTTPLTAALAGAARNLGLLAILRVDHLLQSNFGGGGGGMAPGPLLLAAGLAVLLLSTPLLIGRVEAPRLLTIWGIGQSGLALCAFGLGGGPAIFGGLLNMTLATLLGAAMMQGWMQGWMLAGPGPAGPRHPVLAWLFAAGIFTATALPPSGLFVSGFIIIGQAAPRQPLLTAALVLALLVGAVALAARLPRLLLTTAATPWADLRIAAAPGLQLVLILLSAFAMPPPLVRLLSAAAARLQ